MNAKAILLAIWLPLTAAAQGFGGLGTDATGFAVPTPGYTFDFPADAGPHPDFRIEWWYVTANLTGPDGTDYGVQWTLFRTALAPGEGDGWASPQLWMGHVALTTPDAHYVTERLARGGIGQAGVIAAPFAAWIDDWTLAGPDTAMRMQATGPDFAYDLTLATDRPLVFHGDNGYSVKSAAGQASYYYSQPFFSVTGRLTTPDGDVPVSGQAWLDREWSSQPLAENQTGWDWFSLSFDTGDKMMGFRLRQSDGTYFTSATWIAADGTTTALPDGALIATPLDSYQTSGARVPVNWRVQWPAKAVDVTISAINPNAWITTSIPYWEGPVRIAGSHSGRGYLEMTGYD